MHGKVGAKGLTRELDMNDINIADINLRIYKLQ